MTYIKIQFSFLSFIFQKNVYEETFPILF